MSIHNLWVVSISMFMLHGMGHVLDVFIFKSLKNKTVHERLKINTRTELESFISINLSALKIF